MVCQIVPLIQFHVDIMAAANELPAKLIAFLKYSPAVQTEYCIDDDKSKSNLEKIIILLRTQTGT